MMDNITKFLKCFPNIKFDVLEASEKSKLSETTISAGEKEIINLLNRAKSQFNQAKKEHKRGKLSSEVLFDYEWRVHELREELIRFKQDNAGESDNLEDFI